MLPLRRNQIIVSALVVMIAVAGYLNIQEGRRMARTEETVSYIELPDGTLIPSDDLLQTMRDDSEIGIALYPDDVFGTFGNELVRDEVPKDSDEKDEDAETNAREDDDNPGQAIFVSATNMTQRDYFVSAKLEREQSRAKEKEILTQMIGNENLNKEDISEVASALLDIQRRMERETAAEAMIEAKGFRDAYVRIGDSTVDVIISKSALTEAEVAQIEDIVTRKTGLEPAHIRISPLKTAS
jgi:stage III sporulation protein AH